MEAFEMALLFDYYGELLTERQRLCFDLRHNHDMSLGEIAQELQVSRQGVYDNLCRAEALLQNMEKKTGCVRRDMQCRKTAHLVMQAAKKLSENHDPAVTELALEIIDAVRALEE